MQFMPPQETRTQPSNRDKDEENEYNEKENRNKQATINARGFPREGVEIPFESIAHKV